MPDPRRLEGELHALRQRLDEAWWNEEPLHTIQRIEFQIDERKQQLQRGLRVHHGCD